MIVKLADRHPVGHGFFVLLERLVVVVAEQFLDLHIVSIRVGLDLLAQLGAFVGVQAAVHHGHAHVRADEHFIL